MEFQNKFHERLKAKGKHFRIIKSEPTRNRPNRYFENFLREIINFCKNFEEQSKNKKLKKNS